MKKTLLFVAVAGLALGGYLLFSQTQRKSSSPATPPTRMSVQTSTQGKVITVSAVNFSYDKQEIRIKKGEKLTIHFVNTEGKHNIVFEGLNAQTDVIGEGQTQDIDVPTDTAGTFAYFCSVGNHRKMGMEGKLIVE
ncbi:MAG TPA: hypothetical protein DCX25_02045 [Candidatus Pacebacteria bacterium]|nr:MAG: Plastocyanin [Microgenomates group bacterium GW2011_GWB1_45_17]KKU23151.1 MAG: Plastocyanin [Microgenomates group bacterium GW2011_GWA1_46_15]KKU23814.1 MAG: Blue copper protein [Microgenomates group bacterium GW2011_GWC1_46_15]HAV15087.1 hypothetical protein [Candidatus Paceibacterota bacterium]HCR11654.1 hypothetical protein [Candidatus Paceibacterota bacterium]